MTTRSRGWGIGLWAGLAAALAAGGCGDDAGGSSWGGYASGSPSGGSSGGSPQTRCLQMRSYTVGYQTSQASALCGQAKHQLPNAVEVTLSQTAAGYSAEFDRSYGVCEVFYVSSRPCELRFSCLARRGLWSDGHTGLLVFGAADLSVTGTMESHYHDESFAPAEDCVRTETLTAWPYLG